MKKATLFIILFSFTFVYAQDYIPMLEDDNIWGVDLYWSDSDGNWGIISNEITLMGEIVINGKTYKTVESIYGNCYLREDNGIIYKHHDGTNQEYILYNFTLETGDTFSLPHYDNVCPFYFINLPAGEPFEVISVSTQFIAGENRKVIELFNWETEFWIEGIGSTKGINPGGDSWHESTELVCFTKNGETTYFNGATSCDNTIIIGIPDFLEDQIILYPNPITTTSILKFPVEAAVDRLKIFNLSGGLVRDEEITKNHVTISSMDYASGLYFYQVFSENKLLKTEKFIIQ